MRIAGERFQYDPTIGRCGCTQFAVMHGEYRGERYGS